MVFEEIAVSLLTSRRAITSWASSEAVKHGAFVDYVFGFVLLECFLNNSDVS